MEGGEIETEEETAAPENTAVDVEQLAGSMRENLEGFNNRRPRRWSQAAIFKVLPRVRKEDSCAYEPQVISIGPFHKDKKDLRAMQDLKWQYLHDLLARRPVADLHDSIAKVSARVEDIRGQYSEEFNDIRDSDLVRMMVLDGCFILEYLIKRLEGRLEAPLPGGRLTEPLLRIDLLLLENQIPFFVLETLFEDMVPRSFNRTLTELASSIFLTDHSLPAEETLLNPPFLHLLHLYHYSQVSYCQREVPTVNSRWQAACRTLRKNISSADCCVSKAPFPERILSATKLKEAGVRFKRKEFAKEEPYSILKLRFSDDGTFEIPRVVIDGCLNSQLRNLIAFEQCCGDRQPRVDVKDYFASYCALMSYLINTESDVDVLEEHGIIFMFYGGPGDAARLFDEAFREAVLQITDHCFSSLLKQVNKYCEPDLHSWRVRLKRDYFGNPWAIISVVAAAVLLGLTIAQAFYTAYAYYHPR